MHGHVNRLAQGAFADPRGQLRGAGQPAAPGTVAALALQRMAGNRAASRVLARDGRCSSTRYTDRLIRVGGVDVPIRISQEPGDPPTPEQLEVIRRSLELIPMRHLKVLLPPGLIQVSKPGCAPRVGGGSTGRQIRLSAASLSRDYNQRFNATLLHEVGHAVDRAYNGMASIRRRDPEGYEILASTGHQGHTGGVGERFADAYMIYMIRERGGGRYNHPADRAAYQGAAARRRFQALLSSEAFDGVTE